MILNYCKVIKLHPISKEIVQAYIIKEKHEEEVFNAVAEMNNRPRKCLGYKTPLEVFVEKT